MIDPGAPPGQPPQNREQIKKERGSNGERTEEEKD